MSSIEERLSDRFAQWEIRGRGWHIWDVPVSPEPPFRPFYGYALPSESIEDSGRHKTILSTIAAAVGRRFGSGDTAPVDSIEEQAPEPAPDILIRDDIVEIHASLPPSVGVSKELIQQLFATSVYAGQEPVSFEIIGTHLSIVTQFALSERDAERVHEQLQAHFPEGVFTQERSYLENQWMDVQGGAVLFLEFGLAEEFMLQLATARNFNLDPLIGIVGALSNLRENELALFQVIFEPVRHEWAESIMRSVTDSTGKDFFINRPDLAQEAKQKTASPLYAAVVRIAVKTSDLDRMFAVGRGLGVALAVFSNPNGNSLFPLENSKYPILDHEHDMLRRQTHRCGMILSLEELVSLVHLPSSSVATPKLKREVKRTKAAPKIVTGPNGVLLGENIHAGKTTFARLTAEQRVRHTYVIGASGTGKSTLLFNLIQQDIERGQGLGVLDPHGDLINRILGCIPEHRIDDVVLVDLSDEHYSVGFNILAAHSETEKTLLASDLTAVFQRLATSWGDQLETVLNNAVLAFLESSTGGTLSDLRRFLIEPDFRNQFLKTVNDPDVLYFWKKAFPLLSGNKSVGPVVTRLNAFLGKKPIRNMVSQKENRLDFSEIMNSGKILLASLPEGKIGRENSYLLGSFLVSKFQQAAMARQNIPETQRRDFWLYVDEFHNFLTPSMAEILAGARKYRMGFVLANQDLNQLQREPQIASAVLSTHTRVCFRVGDNDAKSLANGFSFFDAKDIQNLEPGNALCRVERSSFDFNLSVLAPTEVEESIAEATRQKAINVSREKYATPAEEIEVELRSWLVEADSDTTPAGKTTKPPKSVPVVSNDSVSDLPEEPSKAPTPESAEDARFGRGGKAHRAYQRKFQRIAEELGFFANIESQIPQGWVDLDLQLNDFRVACEFSLSTTPVGDAQKAMKCLAEKFDHVALVAESDDKLTALRSAVAACVPAADLGRIGFYLPHQLDAAIRTWAIEKRSQKRSDETEPKKQHFDLNGNPTEEAREATEIELLKVLRENKKKKK
jgi:hypothetical protein